VLDDYDQNGQGGLLVANSRFLEQHRDAVTSFTEVYLQTIRRLSDGEIKTDDQALAAMQKYTDYSQPLEIEKLIDYGPLDAALKNIGG